MRSLAVIGLIVAGLAIPACAQRGGGHGGFSGGHAGGGFSGHAGFASHSSVAFRGSGPARSAPSAPLGARAFSGTRPSSAGGSYRPGIPGHAGGRQPYHGHDHNGHGNNGHRRIYVSPYGYAAGYPYYGYMPWLGGYDSGFSDSSSDNSNAQAAPVDSGGENPQGQGEPYPAADYGQSPGDYGPPPPYPSAPRAPYPPPSDTHPAVLAQSEPVTLVFKDGRPPELVHNYLMTRTTIYIQDEHRHSIPVDQLDMAATAKTNQDAGVDFQVPTMPN